MSSTEVYVPTDGNLRDYKLWKEEMLKKMLPTTVFIDFSDCSNEIQVDNRSRSLIMRYL